MAKITPAPTDKETLDWFFGEVGVPKALYEDYRSAYDALNEAAVPAAEELEEISDRALRFRLCPLLPDERTGESVFLLDRDNLIRADRPASLGEFERNPAFGPTPLMKLAPWADSVALYHETTHAATRLAFFPGPRLTAKRCLRKADYDLVIPIEGGGRECLSLRRYMEFSGKECPDVSLREFLAGLSHELGRANRFRPLWEEEDDFLPSRYTDERELDAIMDPIVVHYLQYGADECGRKIGPEACADSLRRFLRAPSPERTAYGEFGDFLRPHVGGRDIPTRCASISAGLGRRIKRELVKSY